MNELQTEDVKDFNQRLSCDFLFFALPSGITVCTILNLFRQLMCNLNSLYFLLTACAAMAFVHWLIDDLHKYLHTYTLRCYLCVLEKLA